MECFSLCVVQQRGQVHSGFSSTCYWLSFWGLGQFWVKQPDPGSSLGRPRGRKTTLIAGVVLADSLSTIDASSDLGINGSVNIQASIQQLSETVAPLPEAIMSVDALYAQRCAAQKSGQFSSLVLGYSNGVPQPPGGYLPSPLLLQRLEIGPQVQGGVLAAKLPVRRFGLDTILSKEY